MHYQVGSKHNGTKVVFCYTLQGINGHHFFVRHCSCVTKALSLPLHFSELIPKYRSKSSLNLFLGLSVFFDAVEPQNLHKFAIFFLWASASAISTPRFVGVNQSNMGAIINSTSQIKIPPCTFLIDRAQQQKHVKSQVKDLTISTFFLQMLEKSTSAFNLTTKWKTYLTLGSNFMHCPTLQLTFPTVQPALPPPSLTKAKNVPLLSISNRILAR